MTRDEILQAFEAGRTVVEVPTGRLVANLYKGQVPFGGPEYLFGRFEGDPETRSALFELKDLEVQDDVKRMTKSSRRTLQAIIFAFDDDLAEMSEEEVQCELAATGVDFKASTAAFRAFAVARRRELTSTEPPNRREMLDKLLRAFANGKSIMHVPSGRVAIELAEYTPRNDSPTTVIGVFWTEHGNHISQEYPIEDFRIVEVEE